MSSDRAARLRLIGLAVALVLIVLVPYFFAQRRIDEALRAADLVARTAQVRTETMELLYLVRDVEAAAFGIAAGIRQPVLRERVAENLPRIERQLAALTALVSDNAEQLVRIGRFETVTAARRRAIELALLEVETGRAPEAMAALSQAVDQFRVRDLAKEIIDTEEQLLAQRRAIAASKRRAAEWNSVLAAAAQLLLLGVVLSIAEWHLRRRQAAERAQRQAVARAQAILQTVREPILVLDQKQRVLMHNEAFAQLYGEPVPNDDQPPALHQVGAGLWSDAVLSQRLNDVATLGRELWDHELRQQHADGIERILLLNARQMRLPDRDEPAVLMTVADVSAQKRADQQVRDLNRELETKIEQVSEVNRELEAFSYTVSHDLRAPLRHIAGFAGKLDAHLGERGDDRTRHYLDVIAQSAARMAGLIDDLLLYSRLGRHALRLLPVDMHALVEETREMLSADLGQRRIEWRIDSLPVVLADESMMRQLWQNLLGNAVKYTARRERALIEVRARSSEDGKEIEFSVHDNGAGFDMDYASKLFGVFQRLHKASEFAGSGIGLANARRILTRHGGRIWAESAPDQGATFHFTLPTHRAAPSAAGLSP